MMAGRGLKNAVLKKYRHTCQSCGYCDKSSATLHVDHIIPTSRGGGDTESNLSVLCSYCNLIKGSYFGVELMQSLYKNIKHKTLCSLILYEYKNGNIPKSDMAVHLEFLRKLQKQTALQIKTIKGSM